MKKIVLISDRILSIPEYPVPSEGSPVAKRPGFFIAHPPAGGILNRDVIKILKLNLPVGGPEKRRYKMKFLLIVLAIQVIGELIGNKRKDKYAEQTDVMNGTIRHPAEFDLR